MSANFTNVSERSIEQWAASSYSNLLVSKLESADAVVTDLPIHNFGAQAVFKAWIDPIVRAKPTFRCGENGPGGLLKNKKAFIVLSFGGTQLGSDIDFFSVISVMY